MDDKFLKVAKEAALEAGKIIQKYSSNFGQKNIKNNDSSDFATEADIESEKIIVEIIRENFPDHNIIAEEGTSIQKDSDYKWAVDPLDGTISYAAGVPSYTVSIGLLFKGEPIVGVIYHIADNNLYFAQKGKGAYLNGKKITVNSRNDFNNAVVSFDTGHKNQRKEKFDDYISSLMFKVGYIYNLGSGALALAYTSCGIFDAHVQTGSVWDHLAGAVIIREAGGKVTDFEGKEPDWSKDRLSIVASNGLIHDQILEALKH